MNTIKNDIKYELTINKSRFITLLFKIDNVNEIDIILKNVKDEYKGATHYCYAYIIDNYKKCSDDGEPSGTAGIPILNILEKNNLNNILCAVVRYFGGIKLGSGGLIRAYGNSAKEALKNNIKKLEKGLEIEIIFNYQNVKKIDQILKKVKITNKTFNEKITYNILLNIDDKKILYELKNLCIDVNIIKKVTI